MEYFCPNFSNPDVKRDFDNLASLVGENRAYFLWNKHVGNYESILKTINLETERYNKDYSFEKEFEYKVETTNKILNFLENENIPVELVSVIKDEFGNVVDDALAVANFLTTSINILDQEGYREHAWNKLPEEAAHFWFRLLKEDSDLKKQLWEASVNHPRTLSLLNKFGVKTIEDITALKEEAIGQLIAEQIANIENSEVTLFRKFWTSFMEFIQKLLNTYKDVRLDPFYIAAQKLLLSDMSESISVDEYRYLNGLVSPFDIADVLTEEKKSINNVVSKEFPAEIEDSNEYYSYLLNNKYKRKTKFLNKTISKLIEKYGSDNNTNISSLISSLSEEDIDRLEQKNNYKVIHPTLQSYKLLYNKYPNKIDLKSNIKIEGVSLKEVSILNDIKNKILFENPNMKSISTNDFINEVEVYINSHFKLGFSYEKSYLNYRIKETFKYDSTGHNKIALRFNDEKIDIHSHFPNSPVAWGNLTPYSFSPSSYGSINDINTNVLLHEIQSDFYEKLSEEKDRIISIRELGFSVESLNFTTLAIDKLANDSIFSKTILTLIDSIGKELTTIQKREIFVRIKERIEEIANLHYVPSYSSNLYKKLSITEKLKVASQHLENNVNSLSIARDGAYTARWIVEDYFEKNNIVELFSTEFDNITKKFKNKIEDVNDELIVIQEGIKYIKLYDVDNLIDKIGQDIVEKYGVGGDLYKNNTELVDAVVLEIGYLLNKILPKRIKIASKVKSYKQLYYFVNRKRNIKTISAVRIKTDYDFHILDNMKKKRLIDYSIRVSELTEGQLLDIVGNIKYNLDLLKNRISQHINSKDNNQYGISKELFEERINKLDLNLNYLTPLVHHLIQTHIQKYGKNTPLIFSGYEITMLTQGSTQTARIYAGPEEVKKGLAPSIGPLWKAVSKIKGIKLNYRDSLPGFKEDVGGYVVDLSEYSYSAPLLYSRSKKQISPNVSNIPIPPKREMPSGASNTAVMKQKGVKIKLLPKGEHSAVSNEYVKELDQLFNLVSIKTLKSGTYKFFNPLTPEEYDKIETYILNNYLPEEGYDVPFKVKEVKPWDYHLTPFSKNKGMMLSGYPIHKDEQYAREVELVREERIEIELETREDLIVDPINRRDVIGYPTEGERKEHYNKVLPIIQLIESGATSLEILNYIKENNLISDPRMLDILHIMLDQGDLGIGITTTYDAELTDDARNSYMFYSPSNKFINIVNDIVLDRNQGNFDFFIRSLFHEYIHAYTSRLIDNPKTPEEVGLGKKLKSLYNSAVSFSSAEMNEKYKNSGLRNSKEFLTELMTNPEFLEDIVNNQKYNWWDRFLNWLAEVFKIDSLNRSIDKSVFELVINIIPKNAQYAYDQGIGSIDQKKAELIDKLYTIRENLDISDRTDFVKKIRSFETGFTRVPSKGIVHKDTGMMMLGITSVMGQFGFDIDATELEGNKNLQEALDRANALGNIVHGTAESILSGKTAQIKNDLGMSGSTGLRKDLSSILDRFKGQKITVISELYVADLRKGLGGYIDIVVIDENNKIHIYDMKSREKGFDNYYKMDITSKGDFKYSADQRANAQLTLYKILFENMTGYTVDSVNVIKLIPKVVDKVVVGAKLEEIHKYDNAMSSLGEGIYSEVKAIELNSNPRMAALLHEQRLKTLSYKAMDFSKINNTIEKIISELQNRIKVIKGRGSMVEANNLQLHLDEVMKQRTPSKALAELLKTGIVRTNGIIREYETAKQQGRDIKIGQLFHWKELVEAYEGFQEYAQFLKEQIPILKGDLKEHAQKIDEEITYLANNVRFVSNLYTEEGMDKLIDFLTPFYNRIRVEQEHLVRSDYRKLSKEEKSKITEAQYLKEYFEQPAVNSDLDDRTKAVLREELKAASRDIGTLGLWISNVMDSRDPIIAATVHSFAKQEYISHTEAIEVRDEIVYALREYEKQINTNVFTDPKLIYEFLLEKDEEGKFTGYLIDRFKSSLYKDYNTVVKQTRSLSLEKLLEISNDETSQISKIAKYHYDQNKGKEDIDIDFSIISDSIRKVWKDERTHFDKNTFKLDKAILLQDMLDNNELTELEIEEINNNDAKFIRGDSDLTLTDLANVGVLNYPAAEKISQWIFKHAWDYRSLKESYREQYENKSFNKLKELKESSPTDSKVILYDLMVRLVQDANSKLPYSSRIGLRLPGVEKSSNEMLRSGDGLLASFKHKIRSEFSVRPDDTERDNKEIYNKQGRPRYFLPIHYTGEVSPELQSYDVPTIIFKFWQSANDFDNKLEILPEIELAKFFIENRESKPGGNSKIKDAVNNITNREELRSFNNNLAKQLNEWFMTCVYGIPKREQGELLGIDVTKFVDAVNKYTSLNLLGLNVIQGTANSILGEALQLAESIAGEYMSKGSYRKGTAFYMYNFNGILNDVGSRSPKNIVTKLMENFDILDNYEGTDFTARMKYRHGMKTDTLFFTTYAGEHEMQGRFLLSMLADKTAYDKNGTELGSMLQMYAKGQEEYRSWLLKNKKYNEENGVIPYLRDIWSKEYNSWLRNKYEYKWETKDTVSEFKLFLKKETNFTTNNLLLPKNVSLKLSTWTTDDQFEFSYKVRGILSRLHGEYSDLGRVAIQRGAVGRMAFMFRKFVEPGFRRRWGKRDYVERLGDFVEGSYLTTGSFFGKLIKDLWHFKFDVGQHWNDLTDHEKANVRRTLSEITFLLSAIILLNVASIILKSIGKGSDDEDDDKKIRRWSFVAYQAARLRSELLFFISPPEAWNILRSPMASMSVIENFIKLIGQLISEPFEVYERGPWKGKFKMAKYLTNMTPGYRQFYRVRDIRDQLAWFSNKFN